MAAHLVHESEGDVTLARGAEVHRRKPQFEWVEEPVVMRPGRAIVEHGVFAILALVLIGLVSILVAGSRITYRELAILWLVLALVVAGFVAMLAAFTRRAHPAVEIRVRTR